MNMSVKQNKLVLGCAATVAGLVLAASPAAAQANTSIRFQSMLQRAVDSALAAQAAQGQTTTPTPGTPAPSRPAVQVRPGTTSVTPLTLDEAVKAALDHNLNIEVTRLNPQINDLAYASIASIYNVSLTSQVSTQTQTSPSTNSIAGGAAASAVENGQTIFNGGVTQNMKWGGGGYVVTINNNKTTTNNTTSFFNPAYNTNWSAQYTQPLLRGMRIDATRQALRVTKLTRDVTDIELKALITNTLSNVREAYWNYVFAVQSVDVAQQSVDLAAQLVTDNQTRVQVGTMAPIDVFQAQSQLATARQNLAAARSTMYTNELSLKQLIVGGTSDPLWSVTIDPVDRPVFTPENIDQQAAIRRALSERTDLAIAKKNVEANDTTVKYLKDQLMPQADLVANYGLVGLGGTQLIRAGTGVGGGNNPITGTIPGGYSDALSSLWGAGYPRWTVQLNVSYPLGNSSQEINVARSKIQLNQASAQMRQVELQIATEVTNAATAVQSNIERVQAAQAARELAQQQLEAERSKFQVGMSTNYLVIQAQRDLATAQNNELQAILNYRNSLVELDRLQQTTLQNLNVTLVGTATGAVR
jgi:HAE1 family hydrophobic/amphiphilic exporter-1